MPPEATLITLPSPALQVMVRPFKADTPFGPWLRRKGNEARLTEIVRRYAVMSRELETLGDEIRPGPEGIDVPIVHPEVPTETAVLRLTRRGRYALLAPVSHARLSVPRLGAIVVSAAAPSLWGVIHEGDHPFSAPLLRRAGPDLIAAAEGFFWTTVNPRLEDPYVRTDDPCLSATPVVYRSGSEAALVEAVTQIVLTEAQPSVRVEIWFENGACCVTVDGLDDAREAEVTAAVEVAARANPFEGGHWGLGYRSGTRRSHYAFEPHVVRIAVEAPSIQEIARARRAQPLSELASNRQDEISSRTA